MPRHEITVSSHLTENYYCISNPVLKICESSGNMHHFPSDVKSDRQCLGLCVPVPDGWMNENANWNQSIIPE